MQTFQEPVSVFSDAQVPLAKLLPDDGMAAAFADPIDHFVVRQYGAQGLAPVDLAMTAVGKPIIHQDVLTTALVKCFPVGGTESQRPIARTGMRVIPLTVEDVRQFCNATGLSGLPVEPAVEQFKEDPLCPFIIGRIAGAYLARPVVAEADPIQLRPEIFDIVFGGYGRWDAVLDGVLLSRQPKGIIAHGMQNIEALQALEPAVDVAGDVAERMTDVQACSAGIGKHIKHIAFGTPRIVGHPIGPLDIPSFLPFPLDIPELIFHNDV